MVKLGFKSWVLHAANQKWTKKERGDDYKVGDEAEFDVIQMLLKLLSGKSRIASCLLNYIFLLTYTRFRRTAITTSLKVVKIPKAVVGVANYVQGLQQAAFTSAVNWICFMPKF